MLGLSIETSSNLGSVALFESNPFRIIKSFEWERTQSHSELVTDHIQQLFEHHQPSDLKVIAVGIGPGSFTGVRVAINVAKAFGYAQKIPIFACNSHQILASSVSEDCVVITNAYKNLYFFSRYQNQDETIQPRVLSLEELKTEIQNPILSLGPLPQILPQLKVNPNLRPYPKATILAQHFSKIDSPQLLLWSEVKPLYLRASAAEEVLEARKSKS